MRANGFLILKLVPLAARGPEPARSGSGLTIQFRPIPVLPKVSDYVVADFLTIVGVRPSL